MKAVFILGAGVSKAAGAPDMNSFLETARLLVERQEIISQDEVDAIQDVLDARADLRQVIRDKSTLPLDIEGLYGAIEIA